MLYFCRFCYSRFAGYDNTTANPFNPNDPPQLITWGEGTRDEMFFLAFSYLFYQPGDENIVFEEDEEPTNLFTVQKVLDKLYPVFPSPSAENTSIGFTLETPGKVSMNVFSLSGQLVESVIDNQMHLPGYHIKKVNLSAYQSGTYLIEFVKDGMRQTEKLIVVH
ncbi:MAG: T9SS type A sorting domain-containing protein [Bacteroidia bacterium]